MYQPNLEQNNDMLIRPHIGVHLKGKGIQLFNTHQMGEGGKKYGSSEIFPTLSIHQPKTDLIYKIWINILLTASKNKALFIRDFSIELILYHFTVHKKFKPIIYKYS